MYRGILDIVFPVACVGCEKDGTWFCEACIRTALLPAYTCPFCKTHSPSGKTCPSCAQTHRLEGIFSLGNYAHPSLKAAVRALKFEGVQDVAAILGLLLARNVMSLGMQNLTSWTVVPTPLHPRRERMRGFNQSALLARAFAMHLSLSVVPLLQKQRSTAPQASIHTDRESARRKNIEGAFSLQIKPAPSHIFLVDDVATTGATLEEAAKVVYDHGAQHVWGIVVARG